MRSAIPPLERLAVYGLVWWVLSEGDASSWPIGVPFVVLATLLSWRLSPRRSWRMHVIGALRLAGYFAYHSVIGGVDVALRAIKPSMPIRPGFISYEVTLESQDARVLLADAVSLLPGTLSSGFEDDTLVLHVLDIAQPVDSEVRRLEQRIASALGPSSTGVAADSPGGTDV